MANSSSPERRPEAQIFNPETLIKKLGDDANLLIEKFSLGGAKRVRLLIQRGDQGYRFATSVWQGMDDWYLGSEQEVKAIVGPETDDNGSAFDTFYLELTANLPLEQVRPQDTVYIARLYNNKLNEVQAKEVLGIKPTQGVSSEEADIENIEGQGVKNTKKRKKANQERKRKQVNTQPLKLLAEYEVCIRRGEIESPTQIGTGFRQRQNSTVGLSRTIDFLESALLTLELADPKQPEKGPVEEVVDQPEGDQIDASEQPALEKAA